ncbi:MAG: sulfide/dihydroorotate dehydrogenase-like FAD/NAD-binding protein [Opitutales bacterium]|nr:sulfide/dihydroorotate dehydrogenase-like FAD/NAD-binding protein [Opitutales bacterium]
MEKIHLTIDGVQIEANKGDTVLQAARNAGLFIPSLCAHKELSPYGACRLCVVEIDNVRGTPTSCTTPAADGMVVRTNTDQLNTQRRRTLELMMSGHTSACFNCDSREDCEAVKPTPAKAGVSTRCGTCSNRSDCSLRKVSLGNFTRDIGLPPIYDPSKVEREDPFIDRDHNLCILCGICVRTCEKVHNGKGAIAIANRGAKARVSSAFGKEWNFEECLFCGACIDECPTGCLTDRWSRWFGKEDGVVESVCPLCPEKCKINLRMKNGRLIGVEKTSLNPDAQLCALGRFGYAQILNAQGRMPRPYAMKDGEMIPSDFGEALARAAEIFEANAGKILIALPETAADSAKKAASALAKKFGADLEFAKFDATSLSENSVKNIENKKYAAAFVAGDYITEGLAQNIANFISFDFFRNKAQRSAQVVFAGAFEDELKTVKKLEGQVALSTLLEALAQKFSLDFGGENLPQISAFKSAKTDKSAVAHAFFGHLVADMVPDFKAFGLPFTRDCEDKKAKSGYEVLEAKTLAPNFHSIKIKAPDMAKYAKPGQFAILMANEKSERSPFTIIDWNEKEGWVQFVLEEVGRSSAELGMLKKGDFLAAASGPLGTPFDFSPFKAGQKALLMGGCYGIAAVYPVARKLKELGVKTTIAIEASTAFMLFFESELKTVADEFIVMTRDGTKGSKGGCSNVYEARGAEFDAAVAVGCVFMMMQCSRHASKTPISLCSLNPIMVDGTGMCGACRVSLGGDTKFACVDGPFFDLGKVDFNELAKRRTAYSLLEIDAMPRHLHSNGGCHK